ncbi:hypothetical protein COLO4_35833 [Corchorus olitorius]|uniref:Uncharacterized protein n=1 Tax=Corchorus olitorius TaxID=93759 RepID=A0A1R3GCZ3_9ROSI|nr:hypothetical protein COLO4_35833 [Corchorus olitorius]
MALGKNLMPKLCEGELASEVPAGLSRAKQNSTTHLMSFSPSNQGQKPIDHLQNFE